MKNIKSLRFTNCSANNQRWNSIESIIPGIKISLELYYNQLLQNNFYPIIYKRKNKQTYYLTIREKIAIEMTVVNNSYVDIMFCNLFKPNFCYVGINPIKITNINEFNDAMVDWYNQLIKAPYSLSKYIPYIRKKIYNINEVLQHISIDGNKTNNIQIDFDGDLMNMGSDRYKTFFLKGTRCITCGLEAKYFAKERFPGDIKWHFNLYGIDENNKEVLFTKDHTIPKSKGGLNHIDNYQTMCCKCNSKKGNKLNTDEMENNNEL
jgi:hypothetical protein